jgi:hypothetical protein
VFWLFLFLSIVECWWMKSRDFGRKNHDPYLDMKMILFSSSCPQSKLQWVLEMEDFRMMWRTNSWMCSTVVVECHSISQRTGAPARPPLGSWLLPTAVDGDAVPRTSCPVVARRKPSQILRWVQVGFSNR